MGPQSKNHVDMLISQPSASQGERPQEKSNLPTPWSQISSLQKSEDINFCCLSCQVYGTLLWWPQQIHAGIALRWPSISLILFITSAHLNLNLTHILPWASWEVLISCKTSALKHCLILFRAKLHRHIAYFRLAYIVCIVFLRQSTWVYRIIKFRLVLMTDTFVNVRPNSVCGDSPLCFKAPLLSSSTLLPIDEREHWMRAHHIITIALLGNI